MANTLAYYTSVLITSVYSFLDCVHLGRSMLDKILDNQNYIKACTIKRLNCNYFVLKYLSLWLWCLFPSFPTCQAWMLFVVSNTLAYRAKSFITVVKSFILLSPLDLSLIVELSQNNKTTQSLQSRKTWPMTIIRKKIIYNRNLRLYFRQLVHFEIITWMKSSITLFTFSVFLLYDNEFRFDYQYYF